MATGLPVVISDNAATTEVSGGHACRYRPGYQFLCKYLSTLSMHRLKHEIWPLHMQKNTLGLLQLLQQLKFTNH